MTAQEQQPARGMPLATLDAVPILPAYVALMTRILAEHGAALTETGDAPPQNVDSAARMYMVTFPPGTMRVDGMVFHRSFPFVIHFPDGYTLNGAQLWPIMLREDDPHIHALFLAETEVKP